MIDSGKSVGSVRWGEGRGEEEGEGEEEEEEAEEERKRKINIRESEENGVGALLTKSSALGTRVRTQTSQPSYPQEAPSARRRSKYADSIHAPLDRNYPGGWRGCLYS